MRMRGLLGGSAFQEGAGADQQVTETDTHAREPAIGRVVSDRLAVHIETVGTRPARTDKPFPAPSFSGSAKVVPVGGCQGLESRSRRGVASGRG